MEWGVPTPERTPAGCNEDDLRASGRRPLCSSRRSKVFPNCRSVSESHLAEGPGASWKACGGALRVVVRPEAAGALRLAEWVGRSRLLFLFANFGFSSLFVTVLTPPL